MGDLKVDFAALSGASADISTGANQIQSQLDQMDSALQPLRADWTGSASEAYQTAKTQWTQAITDMKQLLAEIGAAVSSSNDDYQAGERTNTARW
jgi:early secretory antigenic target protein ESAT-6